jgi:hypothetical protein
MVKVTLTGWEAARRLGARMEIDRKEAGVSADPIVDVRLRVDFMRDGKIVRSIFATDTVIYDDSGPLRLNAPEFKALFGSLESLWIAPSTPAGGSVLDSPGV